MFNDLPNRLPAEELDHLVGKLRSSIASKEEVDLIISSHLRLILKIADRMARKYGVYRLYEDVTADAAFELSEAVNNARYRLYNNNITPFLIISVKRRLKERIERFITMYMPSRTIRHKFQHGVNKSGEINTLVEQHKIPLLNLQELKKLPPEMQTRFQAEAITFEPIDFRHVIQQEIFKLLSIPKRIDIEEDIHDGREGRAQEFIERHAYHSTPFHIPVARRTEPSIELLELIQKSLPTLKHGYVIELRKQGYTIEEIAPQIGYSKSKVANMINEVEELFIKYERE